MARSSRLTMSGMLAASALLLSAAVVAAGERTASALPKQDREAIARWLDRAERHAAALPEAQLLQTLPTLIGAMVAADGTETIDRLLALVKDNRARADQDLLVCIALGAAGQYEAAIRRAQSLPRERRPTVSGGSSNSWRAGALYVVAERQMSVYDFAAAKKTMTLIDDPETVSSAHRNLAKQQAKAGLYAEAEKSLEQFSPTSESGQQWKAETRQLIARYRTERRKDPPARQSDGMIRFEDLRRLSTIFADTGIEIRTLAEAEKAEKAADTLKGAADRATAWREIAWAYHDLGIETSHNRERCRRALEKSVQHAEKIAAGLGRSYLKTVALASAANLYLELGDVETARQMVQKTNAVNLSGDMLGGLSDLTTTPLLIGVLIRVGDIDGARSIAEKQQKLAEGRGEDASFTNPDIAWFYWAAFCALQGKTDHVERRLERSSNPRIKAVLCAGVGAGLLALQHRPAREKP